MADGRKSGGRGHQRSRHPAKPAICHLPSAIRHRASIWLATCSARCFVQYTIEARDLTTPRSLFDPHTIVEAPSERDAIQRYVDELHAELVSMIKPPNGGESIATIKKEDAIVLVRVYAA
jgi:hypothetical protein